MQPETYWPQAKLYFYATCALFSERLMSRSLSSQQLIEYIPYYFNVDEQINELEQLKQEGLLDFTVSRTNDTGAEYSITRVNSNKFLSVLKKYLESYRNNELMGGAGFKPDTFAANNDQLMKYVGSTTRKEPIVNPANIWSDWTSFSSERFPFWEAVLSYQLIDAKGEILTLGHSVDNGSPYSKETRPFVRIKRLDEEQQHPSTMTKPAESISGEWAELKIDGNTVHIRLDSGRRYRLKKFRTDSAPLNFINYVLVRPNTDIRRTVIQTAVEGCARKDNMTELVRQCGFTGKLLPLKEVFFSGTNEERVRVAGKALLTNNQIDLIDSNLTKSD